MANDKLVTVSIARQKVRKREGVAAGDKSRAHGFDSFAADRLKQNSDRDRGSGFLVAEGESQDRFGMVALRLAALKIGDLAEAIAEDRAVAPFAGGRIEVDEVVIVAAHDDLDAVEDRALAGSRRTDHGDHA